MAVNLLPTILSQIIFIGNVHSSIFFLNSDEWTYDKQWRPVGRTLATKFSWYFVKYPAEVRRWNSLLWGYDEVNFIDTILSVNTRNKFNKSKNRMY